MLTPDVSCTSPVAGGKMLNVAAFVYDPKPWTSPKMTVPATREEAIEAFTDFGPAVRAIVYVDWRDSFSPLDDDNQVK